MPATTGRRTFLKQSLSGLVLLSAAGSLLESCKSYARPTHSLAYFTDKEYAVFSAIAARMVPAGVDRPGAQALQVPETVDRLLAGFDLEVQSQFRQLLFLFEHGPMVFDLKFRRFTELSPESADAYLAGWASSRLAVRRQGFVALKKFCMSIYYINQASWKAIAYPGPAIG